MKFVSAIIVAAGKSRRLRSRAPKPLIKIKSQPVIFYSLKEFDACPQVKEIIVVVNNKIAKDVSALIARSGFRKAVKLVCGGRRRQDSVRNGLEAVSYSTDTVLIHDAARPFITGRVISLVIREAAKAGAAVAGVPVKATIKQVASCQLPVASKITIEKTLDRRRLYEIQTPQGFKKELILRAYKRFGDKDVTDDAMLVEKLGVPVSIVPGSYSNIKITTPEDLVIAQAIISRKLI